MFCAKFFSSRYVHNVKNVSYYKNLFLTLKLESNFTHMVRSINKLIKVKRKIKYFWKWSFKGSVINYLFFNVLKKILSLEGKSTINVILSFWIENLSLIITFCYILFKTVLRNL